MGKIYKRNCDVCGQYYEGRAAKYCSYKCRSKCPVYRANYMKGRDAIRGKPSWIKGKKHPSGEKCAAFLTAYIKKHGPWNRGVKGSIPRNRTSFTSERVRGPNNWRWKGGISGENSRIRNSLEYKGWRMKVFQRDRFRCVLCSYRSKKPRDIRADHIKPFSLYPHLRFDVDNGRTLCIPCDIEHGWNCLRDSNDNFNYHHTLGFYKARIGFRRSLHQVLAPPRP